MRLHVLSDIHLETRGDNWSAFVDAIPADLGDVLVLAGDILTIAHGERAEAMLARLRRKARHVVYVLGNHEHYRGDFAEVPVRAAELSAATDVHLLDATAVEIEGRRLLGCTLWFGYDEAAQPRRRFLSDFHLIAGFDPAVYEVNQRDRAFLATQVRPGDLVITHHLPASPSVAPHFRRGLLAALNPFFLCDVTDIVSATRPALWIHGHTHVPCDYQLGTTRVLANPIGYPNEGGSGRLDLVVDV